MDPVEALRRVQEVAQKAMIEAKGLFPSPDPENDSAATQDLSKKGVSLLQAKCATLLRYNVNLMKLALARIRGENIDDLAKVLVRDSVALSKIRPLEKKIHHHIEHLLNTTKIDSDGATVDVAALQNHLRPNPSAVVIHEDDDSKAGENGGLQQESGDGDELDKSGGIYRPPRLAEVVYGDDHLKRSVRDQERREKRTIRALRTEGVRELLAEVRGLPEEVVTGGAETEAFAASGETRRLMRDERRRAEYEEDNFTRLTVSKRDKKKRKSLAEAAHSARLGGDEVRSLASIADRVLEKSADKSTRSGAAGSKSSKKRKRRSRNDDVSEDVKQRKLDEALQQM